MKVTGAFTQHELSALQLKRDTAGFQLQQLRDLLEERRATAARGEARTAALKIAKALRDPEFVSALSSLDRADSQCVAARTALNRCRGGNQGPTPTGKKRQQARDACADAVSRSMTEIQVIMEVGGLEVQIPEHHGHSRSRAIKDQLRQLKRSYQDEDLPERIEDATARVTEIDNRVALLRKHLVPSRLVRAFALYVSRTQLKLLIRLTEDYRPRPSTIKGDDDYEALASLELIVKNPATVTVQHLGYDVANWATENLLGTGPRRFVPFLSRSDVKDSFTPQQLAEMADKAQDALHDIRLNGEGTDQVELGLPHEGFSYRVYRTVLAVQHFSHVVGPREKRAGPRVIRRKRPAFEPGRVLEGSGVRA